MERYTIKLSGRAARVLKGLRGAAAERMRDAIDALAENPRPVGCKKLKGADDWRIRVGEYRVLYTINDEQISVLVVRLGHRREVYR